MKRERTFQITVLVLISLWQLGCSTLTSRSGDFFMMEKLSVTQFLEVPLHPDHWKTEYDGGGLIRFGVRELFLQPQIPRQKGETFAALLTLNETTRTPLKDYAVRMEVTTLYQLREREPNEWEVFWFFGNYRREGAGKKQANYFILKPSTGSELGVVFGEVGQKFLKTLPNPILKLGERNEFIFVKRGLGFRVYLNRQMILDFKGTSEIPGLFDHAGTLGIYSEDALVHVHSFSYLRL